MVTSKGLIGVIVPVYKVEKYIAECIESVLAQTYTNFRLILVDDGTPDNAGKICDEYAKKDSRITVIHQENAGVTRARARGVEEAKDCEWITFVDGDDTIRPIFLQELYGLISNEVDIVLCTNYYTENEKQKCIAWYNFDKELDIVKFRYLMASVSAGMPWGRLFRKKIVTKDAFNIPRDIFYGEDAIMNLRISFNTNKNILTTCKPLYFYRQQSQGVCSSFKYSTEYEELLETYILKSIPIDEQKNYQNAVWQHRINVWNTLFNNKYHVEWAKSELHLKLISDLKTYKSRTAFFDRLLIIYTNPVLRFIIINSRRIVRSLKK